MRILLRNDADAVLQQQTVVSRYIFYMLKLISYLFTSQLEMFSLIKERCNS